jgi:hypothetical protein
MGLSNLPPGVTDADIERAAGADEPEYQSDVDVLYAYACLGAKCHAFGLRLSASRSHIIIRDARNQLVAKAPTVKELESGLDRLIEEGLYEHSEF